MPLTAQPALSQSFSQRFSTLSSSQALVCTHLHPAATERPSFLRHNGCHLQRLRSQEPARLVCNAATLGAGCLANVTQAATGSLGSSVLKFGLLIAAAWLLLRVLKGGSSSRKQGMPPPSEELHPGVQGYARAISHAIVQNVLSEIRSEQGTAALTRVAVTVANALSEEVSENAKLATKTAAQETAAVSYEVIASKIDRWYWPIPSTFILKTWLLLFASGILLSSWRFALFGLTEVGLDGMWP